MNNNLLNHLHRWAHQHDENFTTEAFAHLLRSLVDTHPEGALVLLRRLLGKDLDLDSERARRVTIETQHRTPDGAIPDMRIAGPGLLAFVEVKVEAPLAEQQDQWYRQVLEAASGPATDLRVVVLTRHPVDAAPGSKTVRWYEIADALELLLETEQPEPARYLTQQFLGFLERRGLAPPRVQAEISAGLRSYEKKTGVPLIFQRKIQSLERLRDDDDLRPLFELLQLTERAIEETGLFLEGRRLGSGQHGGGWIGWNIGNMKYFVYVTWAQPEILRFQVSDISADPGDLGEEPGDATAAGGSSRSTELDLASQTPDFFSRSKQEQLELLVEFLRTSYEGAGAPA